MQPSTREDERVSDDREPSEPEPAVSALELRIRELEDELRLTRDGSRTELEELECECERLLSRNAELTSLNGTITSLNDELLSVNEALYLANCEYQERIAELELMNDDLERLLHVVDAGVVYLDAGLAIQRFNDAVTRVLPLCSEDRGRPLAEIAIQADYPGFVRDAERVLATAERKLVTARGNDGAWWAIGMRMFFGPRGIGGLIMTMHDISELFSGAGAAELLAKRFEPG
jgi:two-component system, chemotaxis family, CheB/CheR fusion protein